MFDPTYLRIFARSGLEAIATTLVCLTIGLPLAWYMATRPPRLRQLLVLLVTIPFWTNLLIRIYCWVLLLRDEGLVNQALQALHLTKAPITFLYSDGAILMGLVYSNLPFMALPIYAALEKLDPRLIEAGYDLYAGRWAILARIVWPLARPGVAAGTTLVFVPTIGSFLAPDILGGGRHLMIGSLIQQQFSTARDWSFGAALSMILMALGARLDDARRLAPREPPRPADMSARAKRFDWRAMPELRLLSLVAILFLYAPLVVLVVYAFNANRLALIWGGVSVRWFVKAAGNADLRRAASNSLIVAAIATTGLDPARPCPAALAFERARGFSRAGGERGGWWRCRSSRPKSSPRSRPWCSSRRSASMPGSATSSSRTSCSASRSRCCRSARGLREMARDLEDAARDLYATPWQAFSRVTLPLMAPAIVAGATLAFVVSLDDFLITLMVAPAGATTPAGSTIYGMLRLGVTPEANAAATLLLAVLDGGDHARLGRGPAGVGVGFSPPRRKSLSSRSEPKARPGTKSQRGTWQGIRFGPGFRVRLRRPEMTKMGPSERPTR